ncbi:hypothetical protein GQ44DRAFT_734955 [Phaeosphaeriaceae sp. PMI808]|nr:hypothetical protein GQ44DRAFT_734955 [Phaeosphaeriaceae sp. PMI808]
MAAFRGRGRGGARGGGSPRGLFINGVWHCDCTPRKLAVHFEVKKAGPNKGKWFRSCQKQQTDKTRCQFFLWDTEAHTREAAALANNTRTEPETPSKRQPSPPPPYTTETASGPSRKRNHATIDIDDEYDSVQTDDSFNNELENVMTAIETPSKAAKTSEFATPSRRKLSWQMDRQVASNTRGMITPQTATRTSNDLFTARLKGSGALSTPSKIINPDDDTHQTATPFSSSETSTSDRFQNLPVEDLVRDVFGLLQDANVELTSDTEAGLNTLLSKYAKSAEGYKRGREVIRSTVKARDAKITELTYRISTLGAELEAEKAMVKRLQWEAGGQEF